MKAEFGNGDIRQLQSDPGYAGSWPGGLVEVVRKRLALLRAAHSASDLRAMRCLRFTDLSGSRAHQSSIRLIDQWQLVFEIHGQPPACTALVMGIEVLPAEVP